MEPIGKLEFPVLALREDSLIPLRDADALLDSTAHALSAGYFDGLRLVDSQARSARVAGARRLSPETQWEFLGAMLNQRIRIELALGEPAVLGLEELRDLIVETLRRDDAWASSADSDELVEALAECATASEMVWCVLDYY